MRTLAQIKAEQIETAELETACAVVIAGVLPDDSNDPLPDPDDPNDFFELLFMADEARKMLLMLEKTKAILYLLDDDEVLAYKQLQQNLTNYLDEWDLKPGKD